ncbi:hypothetical protein BOVA604_4210 [Bacteroides ovatus]|jgi:hypothetical protein|uniref:hypothetical protein n=1 Tax=Bacteroides TaxID=816 RepID=UPI000E837331|nr:MULTISPECIES: hypothetical protein [Bacteroides]MCS3176223.1 hypothetical protein [Candidatus Bacteroides intestinigallinarum]MCS3201321.1 hypothetical protein [Candidatus Bacteroides intestinigallinarum]RGN59596.1 hypothetical protein DXB58_13380 [Bacteroides sp. OM05-10AA]RGQ65344.1 hypothetical protein DWY87_13945 [Bacteroides sp. AF27-33]CAG9900708.1 hypothetical protein BOVA604_4210 [Bacteroides ovatus]
MKNFICTFFLLTAFLFVAKPVSAQQSYTLQAYSSAFEFKSQQGREIILEWRLPIHLGGDTYEGQTAHEMLKGMVKQYPGVFYLYGWGTTRTDDNYLYGYGRIIYTGTEPCTVTITGLFAPSSTVVLNIIPYN